MHFKRKISSFIEARSKLDLFLLKSGGLVVLYLLLRLFIRNVAFMQPVFQSVKNGLIQFYVKSTYFILHGIGGYDVNTFKKIVWIEGSQGVKVINACLGWPVMALFVGFLLIYPGNKKSKYWFVPLGLIIITLTNLARIIAMTLLSYHRYDLMDLYHRYVFNIILYAVVFVLWIFWVKRFGTKEK